MLLAGYWFSIPCCWYVPFIPCVARLSGSSGGVAFCAPWPLLVRWCGHVVPTWCLRFPPWLARLCSPLCFGSRGFLGCSMPPPPFKQNFRQKRSTLLGCLTTSPLSKSDKVPGVAFDSILLEHKPLNNFFAQVLQTSFAQHFQATGGRTKPSLRLSK